MSGPTAIVDYSRPVGWWCRRTCHDYTLEEGGPPCNACIPVFLPIPEGQRPPAASEVEEAEVVTWCGIAYDWHGRPDLTRRRWVVSVETDGVRHINYIVTGATE